MFTVMSWNMNQRESAWDRLAEVASRNNVSVALLQEARRPERSLPAGWNVHPPADDGARWRIAVPRHYQAADGSLRETRRWFASAVVGRDDLSLTPREPVELHQAAEGTFAASHPGQFAVADIALDGGRRLTVVSLYGIWDRMLDSGDMYAEATLHRAISDLTMIFQERGNEHVLVAGDLNIYSYADGTVWGDRYLTVFSRLAAYGLEAVGPFRPDGEPRLDRCSCPDAECRHVNTFLYRSDRGSRPHQLDYVFATPALRDRLTACWADPDPDWPTHSDHRPVLASFDL
ncbi:endonuclease/exonuclease/phosphatase family protein [Promicromonospora sp. Marseille-Q5078]